MTKTERERAQKHLYKQKGCTNWFLRFYLHGKQVRETTGMIDETEACRIALARLDEAGADRSGAKKFIGPEQKKITVQQLLDALRLNYESRGMVNCHLLSNLKPMEQWFGHYKAVDLQAADLDRFIKHAQEHGRCKNSIGKPSKPASINRSLQLLTAAFSLARKDKIINHDQPKRRLSEKGNARQGFFSPLEFRSVMTNLRERWRDYVEFFYLTGMRPKEIRSLIWQDVEHDHLRLRGVEAKTGYPRTIPLADKEGKPNRVAAVIARRRLQMSPLTDLVFHYNGKPLGDHRKNWQSTCVMLGLGKLVCRDCWLKKCTSVLDPAGKCAECGKTWKKRESRKYIGKLLYDLRRTFCRDSIRLGIPQSVVMSISGHRTISTFLRYDITNLADQSQALDARQDYLEKQEQATQEKPLTALVQ